MATVTQQTQTRHERGITLVEILIVLGLFSILTVGTTISFNNHSGSANATFTGLQAAIDRASVLATSASNGATIIGFPSYGPTETDTWALGLGTAVPGTRLYICSGRPQGTGMASCIQLGVYTTTTTLTDPASNTIPLPWAIYFNTDRSLAVGAWPDTEADLLAGAYPTVATEPSCAAGSSVQVNIAYSGFPSSPLLPCSGGAMTRVGF